MAHIRVIGDTLDRDPVITYLLYYDDFCAGKTTEIKTNTEPIVLHLRSKYYYANVLLIPHAVEDTITLMEDDKCEGCIIVLPSSSKLEGDSDHATIGETASTLDNLAVKLLVSYKSEHENDFAEARMLWALDHGFEYVEIDRTNLTNGWQDREKDGLPRLLEALQSNMWSTMERLTPTSTGKISTLQSAPAEIEVKNAVAGKQTAIPSGIGTHELGTTEALDTTESKVSLHVGEEVFERLATAALAELALAAGKPPPPPGQPVLETATETKTNADKPNLSKYTAENSSPSGCAVGAAGGASVGSVDKVDSDDEADEMGIDMGIDMDAFGSMLEQARSLRDNAAGGAMSDEERRAKAADMAMKLASMMKLGDY